jgi:hypothetical protein
MSVPTICVQADITRVIRRHGDTKARLQLTGKKVFVKLGDIDALNSHAQKTGFYLKMNESYRTTLPEVNSVEDLRQILSAIPQPAKR